LVKWPKRPPPTNRKCLGASLREAKERVCFLEAVTFPLLHHLRNIVCYKLRAKFSVFYLQRMSSVTSLPLPRLFTNLLIHIQRYLQLSKWLELASNWVLNLHQLGSKGATSWSHFLIWFLRCCLQTTSETLSLPNKLF